MKLKDIYVYFSPQSVVTNQIEMARLPYIKRGETPSGESAGHDFCDSLESFM